MIFGTAEASWAQEAVQIRIASPAPRAWPCFGGGLGATKKRKKPGGRLESPDSIAGQNRTCWVRGGCSSRALLPPLLLGLEAAPKGIGTAKQAALYAQSKVSGSVKTSYSPISAEDVRPAHLTKQACCAPAVAALPVWTRIESKPHYMQFFRMCKVCSCTCAGEKALRNRCLDPLVRPWIPTPLQRYSPRRQSRGACKASSLTKCADAPVSCLHTMQERYV